MVRVIGVAAAVTFLLVVGIAFMAGVGIVAEGLNELHRWKNGAARMIERG